MTAQSGRPFVEAALAHDQPTGDRRIEVARETRLLLARTFLENRLAVASLVAFVVVLLFCFVGPHVYHSNQVTVNLLDINEPPSRAHPLGTDSSGYDVLGRLMIAGQSSLEIGVTAALLAVCFGTTWGSIAGFVGGKLDTVMMRTVDTLLAVPTLLLTLLLASIYKPSLGVLIVIVAVVSWLIVARLVRGETISLKTRDFVAASRSFGGARWRIVVRHVVPNALSVIVVQGTFAVSDAVLLLAALGYLGLGPSPPATNWGEMLSNGLNYIYDGYWWQVYPAGLAIVVTVIAINFVGDGLRDSFEVRLRRR